MRWPFSTYLRHLTTHLFSNLTNHQPEMAIDPEPLDLARDRLEVDRTEQGTWLEISSIEPNRA